MSLLSLLRVRQFPGSHLLPGSIEEALVVSLAYFLARFVIQQAPQGAVLHVDPKILLLAVRSDFVGAEEESVRVSINEVCRDPE